MPPRSACRTQTYQVRSAGDGGERAVNIVAANGPCQVAGRPLRDSQLTAGAFWDGAANGRFDTARGSLKKLDPQRRLKITDTLAYH